MWNKLIREPLLHFILIGAVLFGISRIVQQNTSSKAAEHTIVIDSNVVAKLTRLYHQHNGSLPDAATKKQLVDDYIRTEILYREAVNIGLEQDNDSLKSLLAGQMSIAYAAGTDLPLLPDDSLKSLLKDHRWYTNDSNLPDTSELLFRMMKFKLRNRYRQLQSEHQAAQNIQALAAQYHIIRNDLK